MDLGDAAALTRGAVDILSPTSTGLEVLNGALELGNKAMDFFGYGSRDTQHVDENKHLAKLFAIMAHHEDQNLRHEDQNWQEMRRVVKGVRQQLVTMSHRLDELRRDIGAEIGQLRQDVLLGELRKSSAGLEFWVDQHRKLHSSSKPWNVRRADFLDAVEGMVPRLKISFSRLYDWTIGASPYDATPMLTHMAKVLGLCETRTFAYAVYTYSTLFYAGVAYCEWLWLCKSTICDTSWNLARLPKLRRHIHQQAFNNFGIGIGKTAHCFLREAAQRQESHEPFPGDCRVVLEAGGCVQQEDGCVTSPGFPDWYYGETATCHFRAPVGCIIEWFYNQADVADGFTIHDHPFSDGQTARMRLKRSKQTWTSPKRADGRIWSICPSIGQLRPISTAGKAKLAENAPPWVLTKHVCNVDGVGGVPLLDAAKAEIEGLWPHLQGKYSKYYLATWDKDAIDCSGPEWPCLAAERTKTSLGLLPPACAGTAYYAFQAPDAVPLLDEFSKDNFKAIDGAVPGGFPGYCRVPLRHGHQQDAIACIKELFMYLCKQLDIVTEFPCNYNYLFVHTNTRSSNFSDGHRGHLLKRSEDNWLVAAA